MLLRTTLLNSHQKTAMSNDLSVPHNQQPLVRARSTFTSIAMSVDNVVLSGPSSQLSLMSRPSHGSCPVDIQGLGKRLKGSHFSRSDSQYCAERALDHAVVCVCLCLCATLMRSWTLSVKVFTDVTGGIVQKISRSASRAHTALACNAALCLSLFGDTHPTAGFSSYNTLPHDLLCELKGRRETHTSSFPTFPRNQSAVKLQVQLAEHGANILTALLRRRLIQRVTTRLVYSHHVKW